MTLMMNKIFTDAEYMAQGFTAEEVPMIREYDELVNATVRKGLENMTEAEAKRLDELEEILGL
jgi:hypothetical protein